MKKIISIVFFIFLYLVLNSISYSGQGTPFSYNDNDSLLFDGAEENSEYMDAPDDNCFVMVEFADGATGDIWKQSIKKVCGVPDTVWEKKLNVKLEAGNALVEGSKVKTDANGRVSLFFFNSVTRGAGWTIRLGPNTDFDLPRMDDFCTALKNKATAPAPVNVDFKIGKIFVKMGEDFEKLMNDYNQLTTATEIMVVHTVSTMIDHFYTQFSVEVNTTGSDTTEIIRVYDGSVTVKPTKKSSREADSKSKAKEMQQLTVDYQNGKITKEEMQQKLQELTQNIENNANQMLPVTVEAGNKCTSANGTLKVEPIESNDDRWWENIGK
jgi:hypothetical protein